MKTLFNEGWSFAELSLHADKNFENGKPVFLNPEVFFDEAKDAFYAPVRIPHDWQIWHVQDLYKNSVGCYKKSFELTQKQIEDGYIALLFGGVYMNCAVWVNGKKAGEWKYGYSQFEVDITDFVQAGQNELQVIAVYQHCNTRWYSGAGIFRDVELICSRRVHLVTDGVYFTTRKSADDSWNCQVRVEVSGGDGSAVRVSLLQSESGKVVASGSAVAGGTASAVSGTAQFAVQNPHVWDIEDPYFYILKTELLDADGKVIDCSTQHCGFRTAEFTSDKGFFLNGRHVKIQGACQHHDLGALGAAFDVNALRRQFLKLKEMGVNSVRCSHNPPPRAWMDLCDELGLLVDDEIFDMWEKPKTPFDYGNYFNEWFERDVAAWVKKDRNHPSLIMWSVGNEIYDTHMGNGFEITKKLYAAVEKYDPDKNAQITIASNYMMTEGAQKCAGLLDTVGYNYLERLYDEHHQKNPQWKIYGSETGSTVQSRGIYHFPDSLKLVTFSDGQCSTLGNCTTTWGCANTQTVIANDRDCPFSAGQYIWTGWDYIGEPTPYHSKNSYFGQIDTAGFPKDTFWLFKSEWAGKKAEPFVHLLPYWDWNEGQLIDVKAYSNYDSVELFFNGTSLGRQEIDHEHGKAPFGQWQLEYHKGEIKAVAYDKAGNAVAEDIKRSFGDPAQIVMTPEQGDFGDLFFVDLMTVDAAGEPVENARNYITFNVTGKAELVGMDNGDSTDYDEYKSDNGNTHTRRLFANRAVAIIRAKATAGKRPTFVITATSADLPSVSLKYDGEKWVEAAPYLSIRYVEDRIPVRKIELTAKGSTSLTPENKSVTVEARIFPENATDKTISISPVLKECVPADYIELYNTGDRSNCFTFLVKAASDGECILRATAKNGGDLDEVLSDLPFTVSGVGNARLNPYKLIEACRFTDWGSGSKAPAVSLESGISNRLCGSTWISFDKVDFGADGADQIHLPIFSFNTELPIEVWDGKPGTEGAECLGKFTYCHESVYNTFNENTFTLNRRLFGVHTISIFMIYEHELKGFYFDKTPKAFAKLRALDATVISGDTFCKTPDAVTGIGNNVTLDFDNMIFTAETPVKSVTIYGKSNTENNSINLKFFAADGNSTTQVIEFTGEGEKTFTLQPVDNAEKVSFVFLPGCNFDFKWFKFN